MVFSEEEAIETRILNALRDAYPDRAPAMHEQVRRWFTRHWRNEAKDPIPDDERCALCDVQRRYGIHGRHDAIPLCSDCARDADRFASDPQWPSRDMVRLEALRALRATGDEEAARFVEELASAFPDFTRSEGACDTCKSRGPLTRGVRAALCAKCLTKRAEDAALSNFERR